MTDQPLGRTLLTDLVQAPPTASPLRFFAVGALFTALSTALCLALGFPEAGVFGVFLSAAALAGPFSNILDDNRDAIWVHQRPAWRANRRTAACVLALFLGMVATFAALTVWQGQAGVSKTFAFAIDAARISHGDILSRRFGTMGPLFQHNLAVLGFATVLAFVFRSYGALLVLGWNAAVWGVVLTVLVLRGVDRADVSSAWFVGVAAAAVLPHLVAEAAGYVMGGLAGIFLSKALARYDLGDARFRRVARAVALLALVAVGLLLLGAALEQYWVPRALSALR